MKLATKEFLASIDKLAEEKKNSIRNTESVYEGKGKIYYVSENGDDNKDGLSPATAIKTLAKASSLELSTVLCYNTLRITCGGSCHSVAGATQTGVHF